MYCPKISQHLLSSVSKIPVSNKFIHHAGIYKGGKPLFVGCNNDRNVFNGQCNCFTTHAEVDVLIKLLKVAERTTI